MLACGPTPAELALSIASSSCDMSLPFIASRRAASARPASSASSRCWHSLSLSRPCCTKSGETFAAGYVRAAALCYTENNLLATKLQDRCKRDASQVSALRTARARSLRVGMLTHSCHGLSLHTASSRAAASIADLIRSSGVVLCSAVSAAAMAACTVKSTERIGQVEQPSVSKESMSKSPGAVLPHLCELLLPRAARNNAHKCSSAGTEVCIVRRCMTVHSRRSVLELLETSAAFPWSFMLTR